MMIVSGFTQKNIEEEHRHGSALDHAHCVTCVSRTCRVPGNSLTSCDVIECPRGCDARYHGCKEHEHVLLCPEERVICINSMYGCPAVVHRKRMVEHLTSCPASIVHCRAEWSRLHLQPGREKRSVVMTKTYEDCGQLDTSLAMRDHRVLVDRLLFPQETSTKSPGALVQLQPTALAVPLSPSSSDMDIPDLPDRWDMDFHQLKKKAAAAPATPPTTSITSSASNCLPDQVDSTTGETAISSGNKSSEKGPLGDGQRSCQLHNGQALKSILSLNMSVECMARSQPKPSNTYTFLCAQDVRREEFPHHFYAVHDRIQSDLNGWMEQRCPLAYLGCPFSFRRFRPNVPGTTVCHSWLLESFGVTSADLQADFSHETPPHLLPAFAETADSQDMRVESNSQSDGLYHSQGAEHGHTPSSTEQRHMPGSSENHTLKRTDESHKVSAAPLINGELPERAETQNQVLFFSSSSGGPQDCQTAGDSFASLLDSIGLREEGTGQALNNGDTPVKTGAGNVSLPVSISGQATQVLHPAQNTGQKTSLQSQHDLEKGKIPSLSSSQPQGLCKLDSASRTGKPQSFTSSTSDSTPIREKQVIYTGLGADSCVRINAPSSMSNNAREVGEWPPSLQLEEMPAEILRHITCFLDSFSLYNLSLVSHTMRDLCCTLLQERGMVSLMWAKQQMGDKVIWRIVSKRWSYSTSFEPVESWSFTGHNPIPNHLRTCPYNQDRLRPREKFCIIPVWTSGDGL